MHVLLEHRRVEYCVFGNEEGGEAGTSSGMPGRVHPLEMSLGIFSWNTGLCIELFRGDYVAAGWDGRVGLERDLLRSSWKLS